MGTTNQLQLALGPRPAVAVDALRDLGMSRIEIARYFGLALDALFALDGEVEARRLSRADSVVCSVGAGIPGRD